MSVPTKTVWGLLGVVSALNVGVAVYSSRALFRSDSTAAVAPTGPVHAASGTASAASSSASPNASGSVGRMAREPVPSLRDVAPMNGIDLASVDGFWRSWTLVDTRYRTDNHEQRFVYANEIAWKAMQTNTRPYPDGAMFGKVAFEGSSDPAFPASLEPAYFTRLQIMKKDSRAYRDSNGWGYAVVTNLYSGHDTPAENAQAAVACHACHLIVPERDYVFSKSPFLPDLIEPVSGFRARFQAATVRELKPAEQKVLVEIGGKNLNDPLRYLPMTLFVGSVNEASAVLANYATEDHQTYFLSDPKSGHFVLADGASLDQACQPGTRVLYTRNSTAPGLVPDSLFIKTRCGDTLTAGRIEKLALK